MKQEKGAIRALNYRLILIALAAAAAAATGLGLGQLRRWNYKEHWDDPRWFSQRVGWIVAVTALVVLLACAMVGVALLVKHRRLCHQLEQTNQALRQERLSSQAKTQFLTAMSYDIRTPMNAIVGMVTIANQHPDDRERVDRCLGQIDGASHYLLDLINNVLDFTQVESGQISLSPSTLSLSYTVESMARMVETQFRDKHLQLSLELREMEHPYLRADEVRLNQIFTNLLANAMQYTPEGGQVTVELYQLPGVKPDHARVVYRVRDNGVGMSPEFMETMYDPFSQAEGADPLHGSGLGLAMVRQIVKRMDGSIQCQSQPGEGTEFVVTLELPIAQAPSELESQESQKLWADFQGIRLLVAEDNELSWEVIRQLLESKGVSVRRAENGQACLDLLADASEGTYRLVLMDVRMPVMDGIEATAAIRSDSRRWVNNIPIVAMTADALYQDVAICRQVGMDDYVAKPVELEKLCRAMERSIAKRAVD